MSAEKPENPPAFPQSGVTIGATYDGEDVIRYHGGGMTLRDYFAGQALAGMMADPGNVITRESDRGVWRTNNARESYALADAMLAERSRS